jgi:hypothetical protein
VQFLQDLKRKDGFYETYRQTVEELTKLREAHGVLINMIRNHHIQIDNKDSILETEHDTLSVDSRRPPKDSFNQRGMDKEN